MRHPMGCVRTVSGALMVCCAMLPLLSGCAIPFFHRHNKDAGCREKPFAQNTENRPPLKVPEGMDAPDTRNAIQVAQLTTPERVRAKNEPCLSKPPGYFGSSSGRSPAPGALPEPVPPAPVSKPAPMPAPAPASPEQPPAAPAPSPDAPK